MSNNRLDESTIRRFMGLAGLQPIGEGFLDRFDEEMPEEDAMAPEEEMPAEEPAAELPAPEEAPAEGGDAAAEIAQDVAAAVADALTAALEPHGVTVAAETGEGDAPAVEPEMDVEPDMDAGLDAEMGAEEEAPLEETTTEEGAEEVTTEATDEETTTEGDETDDELTQLESSNVSLVDDEKIVQEVARRVAARLLRKANSK